MSRKKNFFFVFAKLILKNFFLETDHFFLQKGMSSWEGFSILGYIFVSLVLGVLSYAGFGLVLVTLLHMYTRVTQVLWREGGQILHKFCGCFVEQPRTSWFGLTTKDVIDTVTGFVGTPNGKMLLGLAKLFTPEIIKPIGADIETGLPIIPELGDDSNRYREIYSTEPIKCRDDRKRK